MMLFICAALALVADAQVYLGKQYLFQSGGLYSLFEPQHPIVSFDRLLPSCQSVPVAYRVNSYEPFPILQFQGSSFSLNCFSLQVQTISPTPSCPRTPATTSLTFSVVDQTSGELLAQNESFSDFLGNSLQSQGLQYNANSARNVSFTVYYHQVSGGRCPAYLLLDWDVTMSSGTVERPLLTRISDRIVLQDRPVALTFARWTTDTDSTPLTVSRSTCSGTFGDADVVLNASNSSAAIWVVTFQRAEPYVLCFATEQVGQISVLGGDPEYITVYQQGSSSYNVIFFGSQLSSANDAVSAIEVTPYATCDNGSVFASRRLLVGALTASTASPSATRALLTFYDRSIQVLLLCYRRGVTGQWRSMSSLLSYDSATGEWLQGHIATAAPATPSPPTTASPPGQRTLQPPPPPTTTSACPSAPLSFIHTFTGTSLQLSISSQTSVPSLILWLADRFCLLSSSIVIVSQVSHSSALDISHRELDVQAIVYLTITVVCGSDPGCSSSTTELATMYYQWLSNSYTFGANGVVSIIPQSGGGSSGSAGSKTKNTLDLFFTIFSLVCVGATVIFCCVCCFCWCRRRRAQVGTGGPHTTIERVDSSDVDEGEVVQARVAGPPGPHDSQHEAVVGTVISQQAVTVPSFVQGGGGYYYSDPTEEGRRPAANNGGNTLPAANAPPHSSEDLAEVEMVEIPKTRK